MKKVIELLERAESEVSCVCVAADGKYPGRNRKLLDSTIRHIREVLAELKSPPRWKPPEYGGAEFHKNCITCKNWGHCPVDMDIINQELEPFPPVNRFGIYCGYYEKDFITPEQWARRTGEAWPDDGAVYFKVTRAYSHGLDGVEWGVCRWESARRDHDICVVATEAGPPPGDWRPEEETKKKCAHCLGGCECEYMYEGTVVGNCVECDGMDKACDGYSEKEES